MIKTFLRIRYLVSALLFSLCLSFFLWLMESLTRYFWFSEENTISFFQAFFPLENPAELLSRFIILFTVLTMGLVVGIVLQQVNNNRRLLTTTLNSISDGVITINTNGVVLGMNPVAEQLIGLRFSDVKYNSIYHLFELIHEEHQDDEYIWDMIKSQCPIRHDRQVRLITPSGKEYAIELNSSFLRYFSGGVAGSVVVLRDISELKEAEKKQKKLQDQLHQSQKLDAIGQIAGGVAHDFNNVLGAVVGAAELIHMEKNLSSQSKECLDIILKSTLRAGELTQKLLTFSRKSVNTIAALDILDVVYETEALLRQTLNKKIKIRIENNSDSSMVSGNQTCLQNAFLNIGLNAIQAMPDGGTLTYSLNSVYLDDADCETSPFDLSKGKYIQISISDTGYGITRENLKKIFEPFFTTKALGVGTGLGLATVYGTIQEHKGSISVYSEEGNGTVFHIFIPLLEQNG